MRKVVLGWNKGKPLSSGFWSTSIYIHNIIVLRKQFLLKHVDYIMTKTWLGFLPCPLAVSRYTSIPWPSDQRTCQVCAVGEVDDHAGILGWSACILIVTLIYCVHAQLHTIFCPMQHFTKDIQQTLTYTHGMKQIHNRRGVNSTSMF